MKRFIFACVVTWELLGNIRSEELGCRQSVQSLLGCRVPLAGEAEIVGAVAGAVAGSITLVAFILFPVIV